MEMLGSPPSRRAPAHAALAALALLVLGLLAPAIAAARSDPRIGLRPGGSQPEFISVADEVAHDGVDMALPWDKIQRTRREYAWGDSDQEFQAFEDAGAPVVTLRVTGAPDWAVAGKACSYAMCPPTPGHYDDFKTFAFKALKRYGPGSDYDIQRFALWNEPDHPPKWGGEGIEDRSYEDYSALLGRFHKAAVEVAALGRPEAKIDAGEVLGGSVLPRKWVMQFTRYNTEQDRNDNYDALTFHGYSKNPQQVADKLNAYQDLPGVTRVSISEFGWSVGESNPQAPGGSFKCVASDAAQEQMFRDTIEEVRERTTGVGRLVWLNAIDRSRDKDVRCLDHTGYYDQDVRREMNPYGLYKAKPDGTSSPFEDLVARPIAAAFSELTGP